MFSGNYGGLVGDRRKQQAFGKGVRPPEKTTGTLVNGGHCVVGERHTGTSDDGKMM